MAIDTIDRVMVQYTPCGLQNCNRAKEPFGDVSSRSSSGRFRIRYRRRSTHTNTVWFMWWTESGGLAMTTSVAKVITGIWVTGSTPIDSSARRN